MERDRLLPRLTLATGTLLDPSLLPRLYRIHNGKANMMTRKERMEYSSVIAAGIFASMSENWFDADESVVTSAIKVTLLLEKRWAEIEGNEKRFLENPRFDTPSPKKKALK